mmetsp:Transcript_8350/g.18712  ORF Transcript_8350/g.18712 Transcript_8350/m.18712 type:complete len:270 (-) Transcript_8350:789-1598(-)
MAAIFKAWASSTSSNEPLLSTSILSNASSAVAGLPTLKKLEANLNFSDGDMDFSNSEKTSSRPPMRICWNPSREKQIFIECTVLSQMGVLASASTSTSRPSTSCAKATMRPAIVRAPNLRLFGLCLASASFVFELIVLVAISAKAESEGDSFDSSPSESESLFPLPKPRHLNGLVAFLIFSFSNSKVLAVAPIAPSNKLLNNRSLCNLVCSSSPSRSWDLKRTPSPIERALRLSHMEDFSPSSPLIDISLSFLVMVSPFFAKSSSETRM